MVGYEFSRLDYQANPSDTSKSFFAAHKLGPADWPQIARSTDIRRGDEKKEKKARKELESSLASEGWTPIPDPSGILTSASYSYLTRPVPPGAPPQEYDICVSNNDDSGAEVRIRYYQLTPEQAVFLDAADAKVMEEAVARLESQGWEPIDKYGFSLKRRIQAQATAPVPAPAAAPAASAESPTPAARDPIERLKKLAELRDAGILTEEEFQAKKKELLPEL